jgi:hypothetical protein
MRVLDPANARACARFELQMLQRGIATIRSGADV